MKTERTSVSSEKNSLPSLSEKSPGNKGRLQLVQKFTNMLKNLEGNLEAQNSMLKKLHCSNKCSYSASLENSFLDKNEIASAFISFFGNEASVCLNEYFVFLEEEKKQKKNLEDTIKDLSNMEMLLKRAKFQLFTTYHLQAKTPGREEASNIKINDPRTARFLIPTEFSSNYGESSLESSFKNALQASPFPAGSKTSLSPVSRRDSRPPEEGLDSMQSSSRRAEEKRRLKEKIQGFQELFSGLNSKNSSPAGENKRLKSSFCDDIIDQEFQTVRTTEEEELQIKKPNEYDDTLCEQDFCFPKNYDNLNETSKGPALEAIKEESRTSLECSQSIFESVFQKESILSQSSNKESFASGKRTTFIKEQKVRGNLKEILNSENLIVEFKSAEKKSFLQKYEEKAKNKKSICSKRSNSSKKSQEFNFDFFDANASSKDLRESIDSQSLEGISLRQSKYIQKISNFEIMQHFRQSGAPASVPQDAMKRKKQNDENLFIMPKVLDESRQSWISNSDMSSSQKPSGKKSQWLDLESKLDSLLETKGNSFISPKSSMGKESASKINSSLLGHSKDRKSDVGVTGRSNAPSLFQQSKRSHLDVLEHSINSKLSNLRK